MSELIKCFLPTLPTGHDTKWCSCAPLSFFHVILQTTTVAFSRLILRYSVTIYPSHSTNSYCSIYLSIFPPSSLVPLTHPSVPPLYSSPSFPPHRELAGWSWRRRWRRGQVVTTTTRGGADAVPAVAARRRWTIWDSAPSMAVSLVVNVCFCQEGLIFVDLLHLLCVAVSWSVHVFCIGFKFLLMDDALL